MPSLRAPGLVVILCSACAVGVAPDTHDTGVLLGFDRPFVRDAGLRDDGLDAPDAADSGDDLGDGEEAGFFFDLTLPVDVPSVPDRPAADLGCGAMPGRACDPGAIEACGNCGTRRCGDSCEWSACTGGGVCAAGATRTQPCGNCGSQTQRCSASCAWENSGGCAGGGPCAPGATQGGGCDPCSQQVCQSNCNWGGCGLRPGAACEYQAGRHHRDCGACRCGLQFCLASCQWSTSCVSCCTTCGGCL
jgi:hypothetical protein